MVSKADLYSIETPPKAVDYETVDGDGHTTSFDAEWWKPYLDKKYWEWAPKYVDGVCQAEGRAYPMPHPLPGQQDGQIGGLMTPSGWRLKDLNEVSAEEARVLGGHKPEDRIKAMDRDGVDVAYLYPSELLSLPWALHSSAFAMALSRAHNDWLHDYCAIDRYRLRPAAIIPHQDVVLAVEELERVRKLGYQVVMVRPNLCLGLDLDHKNLDRFWATAQDLELAIGVHEGFSQGSDTMPRMGEHRTHSWFQLHAYEHPAEHMMACMLMITGGVMERFPRLKVGFMESGAGWASFWLHHLDEHHEKLYRFYPELPSLRPSEYFMRQCFLGVEPDYERMGDLIDSGYEDCLVFSSDFPHFDAIFPGSVAACANRDDLTDGQKRKILRDNALRMYGVG